MLFAQSQLDFARLSVENGLSNNNVTCVFQDSKSFVWIGTQDGLNRYDGYEFTHFKNNPKDKKSISNNIISTICEDKFGNLWVGTQDGLNRYSRNTHTFSSYKHHKDSVRSLINNRIYTILEDKNGYLWVGTEEGVSRMDRERRDFIHFTFPSLYDPESNVSVKTILEDNVGNILVGTYGGGLLIKERKKKDFVLFAAYPKSLNPEPIQHIFQDSQHNYWIGTDRGLRKIDTKQQLLVFSPYPFSPDEKDFNQILTIVEDKKGQIWAGTYGGGILIMNPNNPINFQVLKNDFKKPQSISRDLINQIFVDRAGTIWVATNGGGLSIYDEGRDKFEYFPSATTNIKSLASGAINAFYEDEKGVLWIGTGGGGLNKIFDNPKVNNRKEVAIYRHNSLDKNSLSDDYVTCISPSKRGGLWIGTSNGLNYFDRQNGSFQVFKRNVVEDESLEDNHIISLFEDEDEILWIGTYEGGLNRFDPKTRTFKAYQNIAEFAEYTLSDNMVQVIIQDKDGFLWIGTGGGGLNRFDKKTEKFIIYKNKPGDSLSLAHNSVKSIYEDSKGTIWVGTHGGLDRFDKLKGTFQNFDRKSGLPSNTIHAILEDKKGHLWLSTNAGISHFWLNESVFHNYDQYDNLQSDEFNSGASMKSKDGKMYFGGRHGFNTFYPDSVENNTQKPPIYITNFHAVDRNLGKTIHINIDDVPANAKKQRIVLTHEQNTFTIDFVALNYRHSEKNEYQWQLEGHDKSWVKPSKQRSVTYTNLGNGKYKFRVRASNNDGIWNENTAEIFIEVQKAIWDTLWFRLLVGLLIVVAVFGFYKVRIYQVQRQNKKLESQVQERTVEISKQKDEIMKIYSELQGKQEEILAQKQDIINKNDFLEKANSEISEQRNRVEKSFADIQIISEIGQKITTISHHDFVIETVFDKITTLVDVDMFRIGILDTETKKIVFQGFSGKERISTYYHDFSTREGQHLSLWCIENKREILINDFDKEYQNYIKNGKINTSIKNRPQSVIYLPLIVEDECIGVMTVQSYSKNVYTQENINILKTLSTFTSIAIDNYRNYTELSEAKKEIENNKQKTEDSIRYAETIQKAILPDDHFLKSVLGEYFVIFEPQAIVSGDFYWCRKVKNKVFLAVVDCTGHGVPGAFMSIIGSTILNDIVVQQKNHEPAQILEELHFGIRTALRQENRINDDGMDICFCVLEKIQTEENNEAVASANTKVTFSGAKRPLYYVIDGKLEILNPNKRSIGGGRNVLQRPFTQETITLPQGAMIYLATDGYADQNNPEKAKIGSQQLKTWLEEVSGEPISTQDIKMLTHLVNHMVDKEQQRDDITLIGVRI